MKKIITLLSIVIMSVSVFTVLPLTVSAAEKQPDINNSAWGKSSYASEQVGAYDYEPITNSRFTKMPSSPTDNITESMYGAEITFDYKDPKTRKTKTQKLVFGRKYVHLDESDHTSPTIYTFTGFDEGYYTAYIQNMDNKSEFAIQVMLHHTNGNDYIGMQGVYSINDSDDKETSGDSYPNVSSITNGENGAVIGWDSYPGASYYRVYVKSGSSWSKIAETTSTSYVYKKAAVDKKETYTVRALNAKKAFISKYNTEGWSNIYFSPVIITSIVNGDEGAELKWNTPVNAAFCRVFRREASGKWINAGDSYNSRFIDSTAVSGKKYFYAVGCMDISGALVSALCDGTENIHVEMPQITDFQNDSNGTKISWSRPNGAVKFRIYEKSGTSWKKIYETTGTSYTDKNVKNDVQKTYTIRIIDNNGKFLSGYNKNGWNNVFLTTPKITSFTNKADGVYIRWVRAKNAENYRIYRKTISEKSWHAIGESGTDSFTDNSAKSGVSYLYTLRCVTYDGKKFLSYHDNGTVNTFFSQPQISSIGNTASGASVTWTKSSGATYYRIYRKDSGSWKALTTTKELTFLDKDVKSNETNTYTVRALNSKKEFITGYNSNGWENTFFEAPKIISVIKNESGVEIKWNKVNGISSYRIYRKQKGKSWARIVDSVTENSYVDSDYSKTQYYAYTVRCLTPEGNVVSGYIDSTQFYRDGQHNSGLVTENGKKYYYEASGELAVNKIVNCGNGVYYYADKSGVICESEEIKYAVNFVVKYGKGTTNYEKLRSCFSALWQYYPYQTVYGIPKTGEKIREMAIYVFKNKQGNCFCNAAAVTTLARVLGYDSRTITGMIHSVYGGTTAHGWSEVKVGNQWLICDADEQRRNPSDKYFMTTYNDYKIKPLNYEHCYTLSCENGKSTWTKDY